MEDATEPENVECDDSFQFETDHLALRGNEDYTNLLKYIIRLETQKVTAIKDLEKLSAQKDQALKDPLKFVEDLQNCEINFPQRQTISELPKIDWEKYGLSESDRLDMEDTKPQIEQLSDNNGILVRGKKFNVSKTCNFNQLWSCEEQLRLEELLEVYPEELIESNRYKKIAKALGTRTPVQVMSRIQKYFAKLAKAGLPIPGRRPKRSTKEKNRINVFYKKSTFFPQLQVPIRMEDQDEDVKKPNEVYQSNGQSNNKYFVELLKLAKDQRILDEKFPIQQTKTTCVGCQKSGFIGARWTDHAGTDYCTDCVVTLLPEEKLTPVRHN